MKFTALLHHLTVELLRESFYSLKKKTALGLKKLGHEKRLQAYIVNYADDRVPRVRKAERLSSAQLLN